MRRVLVTFWFMCEVVFSVTCVMTGVFGDIKFWGCMRHVVDCGTDGGFRGHQVVVLYGS